MERILSARLSFLVSVSLLGAVAAQPACADTAEAFYTGKQLIAAVPSSAGGSFDQYMRLMAEHLGNFLPGKPKIIVQNMPGGGGVKLMNYFANVAPKDGSYIGIPVHTTITFGLLNPSKVKFLGPDLHWIGSLAGIHDVIGVWHTSPVKSIADARKTAVPMGATGRGGNTYLDIVMANNLLGTRFKVISGYPGAAEINLAIERGELGGRASSWEGLAATQPEWLSEKKFVPIAQLGGTPIRGLDHVPNFVTLLSNPADRDVVDVLLIGLSMGRAIFTTPGVPAERVAALRTAFDKMVLDGAYLADAEKRRLTAHDPLPGKTLQAIIDKVYKTPPAVIDRAKKALTLAP